MSVFDTDSYAEARANRLRNLFAHVRPGSLAGLSVLEAGCGTGELGEEFVKLGCRVTSVDARAEHIEELKRRFPGRDAFVSNLDAEEPFLAARFDIVLSFGLLYHLSDPLAFLQRCARWAPVLFLETLTLDSEAVECLRVEETGLDQSFMEMGCRPSPGWLQVVLAGVGYGVQDISGPLANWSTAQFDWAPQNDRKWTRDGRTLRKMFVCQQRP